MTFTIRTARLCALVTFASLLFATRGFTADPPPAASQQSLAVDKAPQRHQRLWPHHFGLVNLHLEAWGAVGVGGGSCMHVLALFYRIHRLLTNPYLIFAQQVYTVLVVSIARL